MKNRRKEYDFYATPKNCILNLLNNIDLNLYGNDVLEPGAGNGNIVSCVKNIYPNKKITSLEIRIEEYINLKEYSDNVIIKNYFEFNSSEKYHIIIGNPPYSLAKEFVEKSFELLDDKGILIFLLRLGFLESRSRFDFWKKYPLNSLFVLSKRPSFIGKSTDSTAYAWFLWDRNTDKQIIKTI